MKKSALIAQYVDLGLVSALFVYWSRKFIYSSSFVTIDGTRAYSLFDDAMISMRYAWNFSHGNGLVWNIGEHVQGYTNLLMTLLMSVATLIFDKTTAVLSIQITGIVFVLLAAFLAMQIADLLAHARDEAHRPLMQILAFVGVLCYYPLVYWSLMGMETGLLTVLILSGLLMALMYAKSGNALTLFVSAASFGLALLTRTDSGIYFALAWAYLIWEHKDANFRVRLDHVLIGAGVVAVLAAGQMVFQYSYYGAYLPNTYVLKLTGMPLSPRLQNGIAYVLPFLRETSLILCLACLSAALDYRHEKLLLLLFVIAAVVYQIYIGGDAWNYWRMLAPVIPVAIALDIDLSLLAASKIAGMLSPAESSGPALQSAGKAVLASLTVLLLLPGGILANYRFLPEALLRTPPFLSDANAANVDIAIALNDVLRKDGTVGVFWAGAIPYYTDFRAIDFLGKSDPYIASLPPDLSGNISWNGMSSVPGHNKYDLIYSIVLQRPTFVQGFVRGGEDLTAWAQSNYVVATYRGVTLSLLKNSPDVHWDRVAMP